MVLRHLTSAGFTPKMIIEARAQRKTVAFFRSHRLLRATALFAALLLSGTALAEAQAVAPLGHFGNMKMSGEHCSGYTVDLWQDGGAVLGILRYCAGLIDSQTSAILENQKFDPATGTLFFTAKLSVGMDYIGGGREVPSQDVWEFRGGIARGTLSGRLTKTDMADPNRARQDMQLVLRREHERLKSFPSAAAWSRWAADATHRNIASP
jgi:hypothetical protein